MNTETRRPGSSPSATRGAGQSSRRRFLNTSAAGVAAVSYDRVLGASDVIRIGVIGAGARGKYLMKQAMAVRDVQCVAVCDVYSVRRDEAASIVGSSARTYDDHRALLESKDIDAVIVATPDHWHPLITVDACRAGKDVYVEKPMVHNPNDGQKVVRAVRENKRILQVGTQARAVPHFQAARRRFVDSGMLGKVGLVRTWYHSNAGYIRMAPPGMERKPAGLDWDRWLGPAPKVPWNPEIFFSPYKWRTYCGGMILGLGIHVIDSVHQFLRLSRPDVAVASGGIFHYKDGRDTPDVVNVVLTYPQEVNVSFEAEIMTCGMRGPGAGIQLRGTGGVLTVFRDNPERGYEYTPNPRKSAIAETQGPGNPSSAEWLIQNWFECIRSRAKTISNEKEGYYSSVACYMANQAFYGHTRVVWNSSWDLPS